MVVLNWGKIKKTNGVFRRMIGLCNLKIGMNERTDTEIRYAVKAKLNTVSIQNVIVMKVAKV